MCQKAVQHIRMCSKKVGKNENKKFYTEVISIMNYDSHLNLFNFITFELL